MVTLASLWLPVLLSAVAVFFLSYVMWMVLPHHRHDWAKLSDEDRLIGTLKELGAPPGQYAFPWGDKDSMKDPEWMKRFEEGPSGFVIVRPRYDLGKNLGASFLFNLVATTLVAYVAGVGLHEASEGGDVFRLVSTTAFLAHAAALGWGPIWFARSWGSTLREMFDGLVYGLATGAIFTLLW